jgi:hypothetical protein
MAMDLRAVREIRICQQRRKNYKTNLLIGLAPLRRRPLLELLYFVPSLGWSRNSEGDKPNAERNDLASDCADE